MADQKWVKAVRKEWWYDERNVLLIDMVKHKPLLYDSSSFQYNDVLAKKTAWKEIGNHMNTSAARCKLRWEQLRSQYRKNLSKSKSTGGDFPKWKYEYHMSFLLPFIKDRRSLLSLCESPDVSFDEDMPADYYDYEIPVNNIKVEESRVSETGFFGSGVHQNAEAHTRLRIEDAEQDAGVSTSTSEAFPKQLERHKKKHFPSTSGVVQQFMESTSATSMKLPEDENNFTTCRPVHATTPDFIDQFFSLMASTVKKFNAVDQHFVKSKIFNLVSSVEEKYLNPNHLHLVYSASSAGCNSQTAVVTSESIPTSFQEIQCIELNE